MDNKRILPKERNLLKGAIRRVFSRSDLRKSIIQKSQINHKDLNRPRVTKWSKCDVCRNLHPTYTMAVDHKDPIIPVDSALEAMTWDDVINRTWCEENNLQAICETCHTQKSSAENKIRRNNKKGKNQNERKKYKRTKKAGKKHSFRTTSRNSRKRVI